MIFYDFLMVFDDFRTQKIIKKNHLKHMHDDIEKIDSKFDKLISWIIYGVGAVAIVFLTQILYIFSK